MSSLRLLAIIEAETITGPAKNLLQFAQLGQNGKPSVEVAVATFVRDASRPNLFLDAARRAGVPAYAIPERGRFDPSTLSLLRNLTQEWRPDIVQTHAVKSHFLARLAGLHQSRPWVVFHHGYTWPEFRVRLYNELDRWSLRRADQALTVSLPFREQLVRRGLKKSRIEIVHNAIDPEWGRRCSLEQVEALRREIGVTERNPGAPHRRTAVARKGSYNAAAGLSGCSSEQARTPGASGNRRRRSGAAADRRDSSIAGARKVRFAHRAPAVG